jgi:hypothetical protein
MAAPTNAAKREKSSCQLGAVMRSAAMSAIPPLSGQKQTFRPRLACGVDAPPSLDGGAAAAFVGKLSGLVAAALPARDHAAVVSTAAAAATARAIFIMWSWI